MEVSCSQAIPRKGQSFNTKTPTVVSDSGLVGVKNLGIRNSSLHSLYTSHMRFINRAYLLTGIQDICMGLQDLDL